MTDIFAAVEQLKQRYAQQLPPVADWNPALSGDLDMRIAADGKWFYQGGAITRFALVKLFASILKCEANEYFLVTPVEKWRIRVDVAPFLVVAWAIENTTESALPNTARTEQIIRLTTLTEDQVVVDRDHPIWMEEYPFVMVRGGMKGLISRAIYYDLVELALKQTTTNETPMLYSSGIGFPLSSELSSESPG